MVGGSESGVRELAVFYCDLDLGLGFPCIEKNKTRKNTDSRTFRFQISSLRSRLEKSDKELERASVGRVEAERCKAFKSYNNPHLYELLFIWFLHLH